MAPRPQIICVNHHGPLIIFIGIIVAPQPHLFYYMMAFYLICEYQYDLSFVHAYSPKKSTLNANFDCNICLWKYKISFIR